MKRILLFGLIVLLAGCAQFKTTDYSPPQWAQLNDEHLDAYIGQDIGRAQKVFGYQFSTKDLSGQQTVYTWELERQVGLAFSPFGFTFIAIGRSSPAPTGKFFPTSVSGIVLRPR
jgi:hypothetical protein